tara:strand:+ start:155 stop:373 length:219 start_codon:yes stop_codon:yes gene_type:complete
MEDHDYAADVPASMDSYNIVVRLRAEASLDDEQTLTLARNERHLALKMAHSEFVDALTSTQKTDIEALNVSL